MGRARDLAKLGGALAAVGGAFWLMRNAFDYGDDGDLGRAPQGWERGPIPRKAKVCHRTKRAALRQFLDENRAITEHWGGADLTSQPSEFDSVNTKYGLDGKKAARSIADAVWESLRSGPPYCLDSIDMDALNDTTPAQSAQDALGVQFRLPDFVFDRELEPPPPPDEPPPVGWEQQCLTWRHQDRTSRAQASSDCYTGRGGTTRCVCRTRSGAFKRCPVHRPDDEVPF